ncbi:MAG: cbb3-type cytochrome c oxidase subunit 3 [Alphaproteobacteria bacterium]|nr:cbb3-type cytochrome c oxidase subunit 3 [Alphaproteobacteria bacterium]
MDLLAVYAWLRPTWIVLMLLVFVAIVAWAFWPGRRKALEAHGDIPLRDQD